MKFKIDGFVLSLDDIGGTIAFALALILVIIGQYGGAIIAATVAIVCGVPEDDPNRKAPEIFFGAFMVIGIVLEYFYIQYFPWGPNLPSIIYWTCGVLGALINGLEVVGCLGKALYEGTKLLCKNSEERGKDAVQKRLAQYG